MLLTALPAPAARADTADDLARARVAAESVQAEADTLAAQLEAATVEHARASDELIETRTRIDAARRRLRELRAILRELAVAAYVGGSAPGLTATVFDAADLVDLGRRSHILGAATEPQQRAVDEFESLRTDLAHDERALDRAASAAAAQMRTLQSDGDALQSRLTEAQAARERLAAELEREQAAKQAEADRRAASAWLAALARDADGVDAPPASRPSEPTTTTVPAPTGGRTPPSPGPTAPGTGPEPAFPCPIDAAVAFVDSWGAPRSGGRSHEGVDLMAAEGTPNVAVVAGEVTHKEGSLAGLGVYLAGDDGNEYWYFHLSAYEGPPRRVEVGDVVGYTGATGNAGSPHTHFEYHPGGGAARNPYPLVRDAC